MAAVATLAWPRFVSVAALLGLTLASDHEPARRHPVPRPHFQVPVVAEVIVPPLLADARAWPRGMVIAPPETGDRMPNALAAPTPLIDLLSGLFELLGSRGA